MRLGAMVFAIIAVTFASSEASAIETYSSSQFRQIIAQATVPDRNNEQVYFSVIGGSVWVNEITRRTSSDGIYYQFTGTAQLGIDGKPTTLHPGEGIFIQANTKFTLKTSTESRSSTYLLFLLSSTPGSGIADDAEGTAVELYRSPTPVPGLTHDRNLLSLTRVPVPPQSLPDPLHRRTGAALHYILSGVGAEFGDGQAVARGPGSVSYEPAGFTYQWSNPGVKPLIYLLFNVNAKDTEPVIVQDQRPEDPFLRDPHLTWAIYCIALSAILALLERNPLRFERSLR